jgi:RNA-directed DNA polymerase
VDHQVLLDILKKKFGDEDLLWLMDKIINSEDTRFGLPAGIDPDKCTENDRLFNVGMPIGNLTSQMFANLYLNELDQYAKHVLRLHFYIRYMDDIIILHSDKKQLHAIKDDIEMFLNQKLNLQLNRKTAIRPISCGIAFVGFRIWATHRKLKKKSVRKMKARIKFLQKAYAEGKVGLREVSDSLQSYFGIMQHFNSYNLRRSLFEKTVFRRDAPPENT